MTALVVGKSQIAWALRVLKAANEILGWASIQEAMRPLEGNPRDPEQDDGYNLHAKACTTFVEYTSTIADNSTPTSGRRGWLVECHCGYGSVVLVKEDFVSVMSSGKHWFEAKAGCSSYSVTWSVDEADSESSWADSRIRKELGPKYAKFQRIQRLDIAYSALLKKWRDDRSDISM